MTYDPLFIMRINLMVYSVDLFYSHSTCTWSCLSDAACGIMIILLLIIFFFILMGSQNRNWNCNLINSQTLISAFKARSKTELYSLAFFPPRLGTFNSFVVCNFVPFPCCSPLVVLCLFVSWTYLKLPSVFYFFFHQMCIKNETD